jgi:hypothetical protein
LIFIGSTAAVVNVKIFRTVVIFGMIFGFGLLSKFSRLKDDPKKKGIEAVFFAFLVLLALSEPVSRIVSFLDAHFASKYGDTSGGFSVDLPWTWNIVTAARARDFDSTGIPGDAITHLRAGVRVTARGFHGRSPRMVSYANMRVDKVNNPSSASPSELITDLSARLDEKKESISTVGGLLNYALPDTVGDVQSTVESVRGYSWAKTTRTTNILDNKKRTFVYYQTVNPRNGSLYIVTFSTDHSRQYLPIFHKVMRSFHFM